jgi:ketosteroid isomerase-like protein
MRRLIIAAALLAGCGESGGPPPDLAATRAEIESMVKRYHEHFTNAEVDPILAMLDSEFSITWNGEEPAHGREAAGNVLKGFMEFFKSKDLIGKRKASFREIRITQEGNVATAMYQVFFMESADRPPTTESYLQVFKRKEGKWLLYREHRSALRR